MHALFTDHILAVKDLPEIISSLQGYVMGILAAVATLFLVIGGLRYVTAGGDPAEIEKAKGSFRSALLGYALAIIAPIAMKILNGILGVGTPAPAPGPGGSNKVGAAAAVVLDAVPHLTALAAHSLQALIGG